MLAPTLMALLWTAVLGGLGEGDEGAGDVAAVDQGPPGGAVGLDADLAVGHGRAQQVVDHQVDPEHRRVAVGRGVAEEDRRERVIGQRRRRPASVSILDWA